MSYLTTLLRPACLQKFVLSSFFRIQQLDSCTPKLETTSILLSQNLISVRFHHRNERVFRKIRGGGRPLREGIVKPEGGKYGWRAVFPEDGQYTTNPLPIIKMGGRHPETGMCMLNLHYYSY